MSQSAQKSSRHKFKWIIEDITKEKLNNMDFFVGSFPISINFDGKEIDWWAYLVCSQEDNSNEDERQLAVGLCFVPHDIPCFLYSYTITLKDVLVKRSFLNSFSARYTTSIPLIGLETLFDPLKDYIGSNSEIELIVNIAVHPYFSKPTKRIYSHLYNDTNFADFTLIPSDDKTKNFNVHRTVLAFESEFFMKLFTVDLKGKRKRNSFTFEDIDRSTLKEVLNYIYNNLVNFGGHKKVSKILKAAETLKLPGLKLKCIEFLERNVCPKNALGILVIAEKFQSPRLEDISLHMIIDNYDTVKETKEWKTITTTMLMKITDAIMADYSTNLPSQTSTF